MITTLLVPTLSRFDLLARLLQSEQEQTKKADNIIVIDNSNGNLEMTGIDDIITTHNVGVAGSWNIGLSLLYGDKENDHLLIICNDDNLLKENAIEELVQLAEANPDHGFFASQGGGFSFFALRPTIAVNTVGYFDEGFYPAYFEDNDYHYRMKLKDVDFICSEKQLYELGVNGQGSQTLNSFMTEEKIKKAIQVGFESNKARYEAKWGGEPTKEIYTKAFNIKI